MALTISPSAQHEVTRHHLLTRGDLLKFGSKLLSCCLDRKEMFDLAAISVNFDNLSQQYEASDFLDSAEALLFSGMLEFSKCWWEGNPWPATRVEWVTALLPHFNMLFSQHPEYPEVFKLEALKKVMQLPPAYPGDYDMICDGLIDYILGIRYQQLELRTNGLDPSAKRKAYEDVALKVRIPSSRIIIQSNDSIMDNIFANAAPVKPFRTGVRSFDHYYGDRARGGDAWLVFGHPGGGKTNFGCQTAGFTAAEEKLVAYVTTEVKKPTILQRCCSAQSGIPYGILRAMSGDRGHPQAATFANWVYTVGKNIAIFDYREVDGRNYKEKFKRMLDAFYRQYGRTPDLMIWDWIGKALDAGFNTPWEKREAYNGVATMMVDTADELDNASITLAQASKDSKNKTNLTEQDTADSRSLADGMEGALGITSLIESAEQSTAAKECHKEHQYWVVCKCREEQALRLPVKRRFELARFESAV